MCTLYMGTEGIVVKDAIKMVNRNIAMFQQKLQGSISNGNSTPCIRQFYEAKIESQKATLRWLEKAL